jgi:hypothetical protein
MIAQIQVRRVHAEFVVAAMKYIRTLGHRAVVDNPRNPVRLEIPSANFHESISMAINRPIPFPARTGTKARNARPKPPDVGV